MQACQQTSLRHRSSVADGAPAVLWEALPVELWEVRRPRPGLGPEGQKGSVRGEARGSDPPLLPSGAFNQTGISSALRLELCLPPNPARELVIVDRRSEFGCRLSN